METRTMINCASLRRICFTAMRMKMPVAMPMKMAIVALCLLLATPVLTAQGTQATAIEGLFVPSIPPAPLALPALPPLSAFPIQLVIDDDSSEGSFGVAGPPVRSFLWFNRFDLDVPAMDLEQVWVMFSPDPNGLLVGDPVDLVIYGDADSDPSNGASLLASVPVTVSVSDGLTFSVYDLDPAVQVNDFDSVLIGVVPRGPTVPPVAPAAIDTGVSQGRSWIGVWSGDPTNPPLLMPPASPDQLLAPVDGFVAGNWMIRGFGSEVPVVVIPTLNGVGLALFAILLLLGGARLLRRRELLNTARETR